MSVVSYMRLAMQRWQWIVVPAILLAVIAAGLSLLRPRAFTATASLFFNPVRSEIALDERYVTTNSAAQIGDLANRRRTLVELATSPAMVSEIPPASRRELGLADIAPGELSDKIMVDASADLIYITARDVDPERALRIANVWATAVVSVTNRLLAPVDQTEYMRGQLEAMRQRASEAQQRYEQFLGTSRIDAVSQQVLAVTELVSATLSQDVEHYNSLLERAASLEHVLRDAEALRGQLREGQRTNFGEQLAVLSLSARAAGGGELPVQLQLDQAAALSDDPAGTLDTLIESLRSQIADVRGAAGRIGTSVGGQGISDSSGLTAAQRADYLQQLSALRQQEEELLGRRNMLEQERDIALDALEVAERKIAEQQVAVLQPSTDVRLTALAQDPLPAGRGTVRNAILGGLLGSLLGGFALMTATFRNTGDERHRGTVGERRADSPAG